MIASSDMPARLLTGLRFSRGLVEHWTCLSRVDSLGTVGVDLRDPSRIVLGYGYCELVHSLPVGRA